MADSYPLTQARSRLGELASRARFGHERIVLTEHNKPVAAIISFDELEELRRLEDAADIAEAQAIVAAGRPTIPHHQAMILFDLDDAVFGDVIAEIEARGDAGMPDGELAELIQSRRDASGG